MMTLTISHHFPLSTCSIPGDLWASQPHMKTPSPAHGTDAAWPARSLALECQGSSNEWRQCKQLGCAIWATSNHQNSHRSQYPMKGFPRNGGIRIRVDQIWSNYNQLVFEERSLITMDTSDGCWETVLFKERIPGMNLMHFAMSDIPNIQDDACKRCL